MHPAEPVQGELGTACLWDPRRMETEDFCCQLGSRHLKKYINGG